MLTYPPFWGHSLRSDIWISCSGSMLFVKGVREMIQLCIRITVPAAAQQDVLDTCHSVIGPSQVKTGCVGCWMYQDTSDPNTLFYLEEWERQEDFERHVRSEHHRTILSLMDASSRKPQLQINVIAERSGIEYIASVRGVEST